MFICSFSSNKVELSWGAYSSHILTASLTKILLPYVLMCVYHTFNKRLLTYLLRFILLFCLSLISLIVVFFCCPCDETKFHVIQSVNWNAEQWSVRSEGSGEAARSDDDDPSLSRPRRPSILPTNVMQAVIGITFIADHMKRQDRENAVRLSILFCYGLYRLCSFHPSRGFHFLV